MADTLGHYVDIHKDAGILTQGNRAHQQVGQEEHQVGKTEADQQVVEHAGHVLLAKDQDADQVPQQATGGGGEGGHPRYTKYCALQLYSCIMILLFRIFCCVNLLSCHNLLCLDYIGAE